MKYVTFTRTNEDNSIIFKIFYLGVAQININGQTVGMNVLGGPQPAQTQQFSYMTFNGQKYKYEIDSSKST